MISIIVCLEFTCHARLRRQTIVVHNTQLTMECSMEVGGVVMANQFSSYSSHRRHFFPGSHESKAFVINDYEIYSMCKRNISFLSLDCVSIDAN